MENCNDILTLSSFGIKFNEMQKQIEQFFMRERKKINFIYSSIKTQVINNNKYFENNN